MRAPYTGSIGSAHPRNRGQTRNFNLDFSAEKCYDQQLSLTEDSGVFLSATILQFPVNQLTPGQLTSQQLAHDFINFAAGRNVHYVYWREDWWQWHNTCYRKLSEPEFISHLSVFLEQWLPKRSQQEVDLTRRLCGDVEAVVRARLTQGDTREAPFDLVNVKAPAGHHISLQNGILDVEALIRGDEQAFRALTPNWFSTNALPFYYNPQAECPQFLTFLNQIFDQDVERIAFVQEFIGWCCVYDYSFQHALVLSGDGANGKGVLSKVIEALLGEDNVSHVPLERFGQRFQLAPTVGKLLNMAPEMSTIDKSDEEQLKSITGGDRISIDVKHKAGLDVKMTARCIFSTNSIPPFFDRSGGLRRRLIILPFNRVVPEHERVLHLERRFYPELAGIFNWAVSGLKRLRERGRFEVPQVCQSAVEKHMKDSNPARTFLEDECQREEGVAISSMSLYAAYVSWFKEQGHSRLIMLSQPQFASEVARVLKLESEQIRAYGERKRYYRGLSHPDGDMITC
jgi:P4 family phage/plasmid primase-like protien